MGYLGLTLYRRRRFERHFDCTAPRAEKVTVALGPMSGYVAFMQGCRQSSLHTNRLQRRLALRTIREYRTISVEAASLLAGMASLQFMVEERVTYWIACCIRRGELHTERNEVEMLKRQDRQNIGRPIARALLPILEEWCGRRTTVTFCHTPMPSGHGCFGEYLLKIVREPTAQWHHCGDARDTPRYTLEECPSWSAPQRFLRGIIGADLLLPTVVNHMVAGWKPCTAVASFYEQVMSQKEARATPSLTGEWPLASDRRPLDKLIFPSPPWGDYYKASPR
ncbi:uncharacterized protein LOC143361735 [Halictus rubicundus]|uniref:uncharacterized protein LOC143361735 n=1 Tax=Halictus rubicundus TaxID=77578 RepID=UPI0040360212